MNSLLRERSDAPMFSASTYDGKAVDLSALLAGGPVVLSFLRSLS